MGWWQTICTCAGCIAGAACVILTGGTGSAVVVPLLLATGTGGIAGNLIGSKVDQEENKVKNQAKDLEIRGQTIETLKKDNEQAQTEINQLKKKREELAEQKKQDQKDLEFAKNKANDSSLSEDERRQWRLKVIELEEKLSKNDNADRGLLKRIKELQDKVSNNNQTIANVGSSSHDNKKEGIWQFITLENVFIIFAVYALWKIIIQNEQRY